MEGGNTLSNIYHCVNFKEKIQEIKPEQNQFGHNPVEDASASLILAIRRAKLGRDKFQIYDKSNHKLNLLETITKIQKRRMDNQPMFFQRHIKSFPLICLEDQMNG